MEIERGNTSCLYLHVLISTEPNNNNRTGAIRSVRNASVWLWTWKNATLQIGGRSVAFFKKHPKHASILSEPWSYCISEIPKVAMETHHYIELVLLWTVMWKIFTFPFLCIACGVTNNTQERACVLCVSKCLFPNVCYYSHQGQLTSDWRWFPLETDWVFLFGSSFLNGGHHNSMGIGVGSRAWSAAREIFS